MQYAITVIHPSGETELFSDPSGVVAFASRDEAERMTWRLSACNDGDLYEVTELTQ